MSWVYSTFGATQAKGQHCRKVLGMMTRHSVLTCSPWRNSRAVVFGTDRCSSRFVTVFSLSAKEGHGRRDENGRVGALAQHGTSGLNPEDWRGLGSHERAQVTLIT